MARETWSPRKKSTRRDAKVGAEFGITLGYGGINLAYVAKITDRFDVASHARGSGRVHFEYTAVPSPSFYEIGQGGRMSLAECSELCSRGLMIFSPEYEKVERPDPDYPGLCDLRLKMRPMTAAEEAAADAADASWKRFTQSETYQSM